VFGVGVHPWMIGAPHRIRYLKEALEAAVGISGVLPATAGQIAQWFLEGASP
jgi:allantoinase